ncbi:MAG: ABC transporter permease subunit [Anaeroplasma sp.]
MEATVRKHQLKLASHNIPRIIYIGCILLFCILPLFFLLFNITSIDLSFVLKDKIFYDAFRNSIFYTFISTVITLFLALIAAYFLNFSSIKYKKFFGILLTIPMLVPTLSIGLGLRVLSGKNGFLDQLIGIDNDLLGYSGLIIGSIVVSFPSTFLILYDALRYENKEPYDAAKIMCINSFSSFIKITLPYLKKPLITAFFASFTLIFSDYGIPMEIAGKIKTLPMYLYEQVMANFKYGRAAFVGFILLLPAIVSFILDLFLKEGKGEENKNALIKSGRIFNAIAIISIVIISIFLFIPQLSFISLTFMEGYPNNIHFSLNNLASIFDVVHGVGLLKYVSNSLIISLLTGLIGVSFAFTAAYFSSRIEGFLGKILNFLAMASIAIPGIVLGIGYIFLFKGTNGFFYGTISIIVSVNIAHFLGSPFIMARNCLSKINKDYEIIGNTLGLSKIRIFFRILIPMSIGTLLEMFSYFFLNSMITISAVTFLCTYKTQPLAVLISTYDKTGNYEMQAVISFIILLINVIFKGLISLFMYIFVIRKINRKENEYMEINKYQFDLLTFLEKNGSNKYTQRYLSDMLTISLGTINKEVNYCQELGFIQIDSDGKMQITEKGLKVLEPYAVRKAIILAAGFGSRLAPVTLDTPKPLVKVNGVRIIDTILDSLVAKGITNIVIVRGYKKEMFDVLLDKYPFIKFIDNNEFNVTNNISSVVKALDYIDRCYICEADLLIDNPDIINKYEYTTNYLGIKVKETDDWCFTKKGNYIDTFKIGGDNCYQTIGISYWNEEDSKKLKQAVLKLYNSRGGKESFWDMAALRNSKKDFKIEIRNCYKSDVTEIDNFSELVVLDSSYKDYPGHEKY